MSGQGERAALRIRLTIIVVVLTVLALGSFWILQSVLHGSDDAKAVQSNGKPDYYIEKFSYVKMSETGQPRYDITGERMVHFPVDDSFEVTQPVLTSLDKNKPPMTMRAKRGRIEDDNSKVHLYDDVHADRPAFGTAQDVHLSTNYLLVLPDDDVAKTDKPVVITMGDSIMTGTGMIINDATQEFHLLNDVRGTYQPRRN